MPSLPPPKPRKKPKSLEPLFTPEEPSYKERVRLRKKAEREALPGPLREIADQAELLTDLFHFKEER